MKINIDPQITNTNVYKVRITLVSGLITSYYDTTFNLNQSEVAVNRAIKAVKMKDVDSVNIEMLDKICEL